MLIMRVTDGPNSKKSVPFVGGCEPCTMVDTSTSLSHSIVQALVQQEHVQVCMSVFSRVHFFFSPYTMIYKSLTCFPLQHLRLSLPSK